MEKITKKKLQQLVDSLNKKYCANSKNYLIIDEAYGGYQIMLTGKKDKRTKNKFIKNSLESGREFITYGHHPINTTYQYLLQQDGKGAVLNTIKYHNRKR